MIAGDELEALIETALPGVEAHVRSGDGVHFEAVVIGEVFAGKPLLQQHRLVMNAIGEHLATEAVHALSLKTFTPERWERLRGGPAAGPPS